MDRGDANYIIKQETKVLVGFIITLLVYTVAVFAYLHTNFPTDKEFKDVKDNVKYIRDRIDRYHTIGPTDKNTRYVKIPF